MKSSSVFRTKETENVLSFFSVKSNFSSLMNTKCGIVTRGTTTHEILQTVNRRSHLRNFIHISNWFAWGGRVVRWFWVNFQCRGVLLVWITVGQGPSALAVGACGGCLEIFTLVQTDSFCLLSPSLWEKARYRLKYCLKGLLSPKQPTDQPTGLHKLFVTD